MSFPQHSPSVPSLELMPLRRQRRRPSSLFSDYEIQVLRLLRGGASCAEVAAQLGVNERSVRDAQNRSRRRLGGETLDGLAALLAS